MQDPDLKCRHFGILWQFMAFWHFGIFAKKLDRKSDTIFPILSDFYLIFSDFQTFPDFPTFRFHSSIQNPIAELLGCCSWGALGIPIWDPPYLPPYGGLFTTLSILEGFSLLENRADAGDTSVLKTRTICSRKVRKPEYQIEI